MKTRLSELVFLVCITLTSGMAIDSAFAQPDSHESYKLQPPTHNALEWKKVVRVEVVSKDPGWGAPPSSTIASLVGEPLTASLARRAMQMVVATGFVSDVSADAIPENDGVLLRIEVVPQRVVEEIQTSGDAIFEILDVLRSIGIERNRTVNRELLHRGEEALVEAGRKKGYLSLKASVSTRSTDDPKRVLLLVNVESGHATKLTAVRVDVLGLPMSEPLRPFVERPGVIRGDLLDEDVIAERIRNLGNKIRASGFYKAEVTHRIYQSDSKYYAQVEIRPGPYIRIRFEGNLAFDADQLNEVLDIGKETDRSPGHLAQKIRSEYVRQGFLDAEINVMSLGQPNDVVDDWLFQIRENNRVRVAARTYPCFDENALRGEKNLRLRTSRDIGREIDGVLEDSLPGVELFGAVEPNTMDQIFGPVTNTTGARVAPVDLYPRSVYAPDVYDKALKHVQDVFRADGYLGAIVGPAQVIRRVCDRKSPAGRCISIRLPKEDEPRCAVDTQETPVEEPALSPKDFTCVPDPAKGITCEARLGLRIPIILGPRSTLYDVVFEGVSSFSEKDLFAKTGLKPGEPASNIRLEEARRTLLDIYREEGFAFAEVRAVMDLSPDHQRARARFIVVERQKVLVDRIDIRGANITLLSVIRAQLRFREGDTFKLSAVRRSEELLAALGVFSSVTIALEDAAIPATRKAVVVTVIERAPQYLEVRPGISTGEGVRGLLEYGHRNLFGRAISLTFRVQLGYLPTVFIPDQTVRDNFDKLSLGDRLERRDTVTILIPSVFHPTIRFGVDFVDVRSNARDFGITKQAVLPAFTWQPFRQFTTVLGTSVELNNVKVFSGQDIITYLSQPGISNDLSRLLRVPDGETTAVAERLFLSWDRRNNPLGATQGTLLAGSVEHVNAFPAEDNPKTITSDFLRWSGTASVYTKTGLGRTSIAVSLRAGVITQLRSGSKTYPDRLFFLGGVDSMRGFTRDALVPQDVADRIETDASKPASDPTKFSINQVAIRGGDVFINPRFELRIPLTSPFETALFLDSGNVWVDRKNFEPWRLRYAVGTGLRAVTPIGPIAFDVGFNLAQRSWEDLAAIAFSIGLFLYLLVNFRFCSWRR